MTSNAALKTDPSGRSARSLGLGRAATCHRTASNHLFIAPADFDGAVAFYRDALGWRSVSSWGGASESRGIILDGGAVSIVLAERHASEDHSWSHGINGQRPTVHLAVENLDERFAQLGSRVNVVVRPEATHWGTRWFVVKDPDGNLIAYEQPIPKKPGA